MKKSVEYLKACLLAGAVGDALGWPIEFKSHEEITHKFAPLKWSKLKLNRDNVVEVTDDTQMTLFTLEGIVNYLYTDKFLTLAESLHHSYLRWYKTQEGTYVSLSSSAFDLMSYPQLFHQRSPGNTCLSALRSGIMGTIEKPINDSKGCGGVMRVAPIGYFFEKDEAFNHGCNSAAITHGHPMGYLSSGALAYMMSLIFNQKNLKDTIVLTIEKLKTISQSEKLISLLEQALSLSFSDKSDIHCIKQLGEGWVGEEALAIAVFCSLRHSNDLYKALLVSVTHDGDSDSTGSITGNILGASLGMDAIQDDWLKTLEVTEIVISFCNTIEKHDKS
jgi:ADP-ribosylglycohydrolase